MALKMDQLEFSMMVGIRALSLVAREQLGSEATPESVAERYLALRQRAYDNLKSEPNPSADEVAAVKAILKGMEADLRRGECNCAYCTAARALAHPEAVH